MADSPEPKKETVRITLPPRPSAPAEGCPGPRSGDGSHQYAGPSPGQWRTTAATTRPDASTWRRSAARPPMAHAPIPPAPAKPVMPPPLFKGKPVAPGGGQPPSTPLLPKTPPPSALPATSAASANCPSPGPKKETARITVLPDPPPKPAGGPVQMKKTQPLSTMPEPVAPVSPIKVDSVPVPALDGFRACGGFYSHGDSAGDY